MKFANLFRFSSFISKLYSSNSYAFHLTTNTRIHASRIVNHRFSLLRVFKLKNCNTAWELLEVLYSQKVYAGPKLCEKLSPLFV